MQDFDRKAALGVFERIAGSRGWVLAVGPGDPALKLADGWKIEADEVVRGRAAVTVSR